MRRAIVELLFVEGNHNCPSCEKSGRCQLQAVGVRGRHDARPASPTGTRCGRPTTPRSAIWLERDRCIFCQRCVEFIRDEDTGRKIFTISRRGAGCPHRDRHRAGQRHDRRAGQGGGEHLSGRGHPGEAGRARRPLSGPAGSSVQSVRDRARWEGGDRDDNRDHGTGSHELPAHRRGRPSRPPYVPTRSRSRRSRLCGCWGCTLSILDMDERILPLLDKVTIVRSSLTDIKRITERCAIGFVEGGVANEENIETLRALPGELRRPHLGRRLRDLGRRPVAAQHGRTRGLPRRGLRRLARPRWPAPSRSSRSTRRSRGSTTKVFPCHEVVQMDYFIPGCPPDGDAVFAVSTTSSTVVRSTCPRRSPVSTDRRRTLMSTKARHRPHHPDRGPRQGRHQPRRRPQVVDARLHVVEFRGYEKFVQGHPYWEAPVLLQRICGICFVSHHLAGAKVLDDIVGVGGTGPGWASRRRPRRCAGSAITRRCCSRMRRPTSTSSCPRCCSGWTRRPSSATSSA